MFDVLQQRIKENNLPIFGTCAGCVLLAHSLTIPSDNISLLQAMNMQVQRNGFGPQKKSFEHMISLKEFSQPFPAVFIRAPIIKKVWGSCRILAEINKTIVAVQQQNYLALSFHPELTADTRFHQYFLDNIL